MACGAALFNLRLALHGHADPADRHALSRTAARPDLLAVIRHGGTKEPTPEQTRLLLAVPAQRTDRRPFSDAAVVPARAARPAPGRARRRGLAARRARPSGQRASLRTLVLRAHRLQTADPAFRAELATWSPTPSRTVAAAGGPAGPSRDCATSPGPGVQRAGQDFEEEPLIARADLAPGRHRRRRSRSARPCSGSCSRPRPRDSPRRSCPRSWRCRRPGRSCAGCSAAARPPQAVLRIGHGWPVAASPRRDTIDLLAPGAANPT